MTDRLQCLVIGYDEPPFQEYEQLVRRFGERSEADRDQKFSVVNVDGAKLDYVAFLNHVYRTAKVTDSPLAEKPTFLSGAITNLAAAYLCAFIRKRGFSAEFVNLVTYETDQLKQNLDRDLSCVVITTTFYVMNQPVVDIVRLIRRYNAKTKIVVRGPLTANHLRQRIRRPEQERA